MGLRRPWNARHSRPSKRYLPSGETASFHLRPSQNQLASWDQPGGDGVTASYFALLLLSQSRSLAMTNWPVADAEAGLWAHSAATLTLEPIIECYLRVHRVVGVA